VTLSAMHTEVHELARLIFFLSSFAGLTTMESTDGRADTNSFIFGTDSSNYSLADVAFAAYPKVIPGSQDGSERIRYGGRGEDRIIKRSQLRGQARPQFPIEIEASRTSELLLLICMHMLRFSI